MMPLWSRLTATWLNCCVNKAGNSLPMEINWNVQSSDRTLIDQIMERAEKLNLVSDRMTREMDITAVHCNGCPLRLADLLAGSDFDFVHDFCGIARNIDRKTGRLRNCFLPRYAAPTELAMELS